MKVPKTYIYLFGAPNLFCFDITKHRVGERSREKEEVMSSSNLTTDSNFSSIYILPEQLGGIETVRFKNDDEKAISLTTAGNSLTTAGIMFSNKHKNSDSDISLDVLGRISPSGDLFLKGG